MKTSLINPVDRLAEQDKCRIYFSRVVDLAVFSGLLDSDSNTEIGHFAFSVHYYSGKKMDGDLQAALELFREEHPDLIADRGIARNELFAGAPESFVAQTDAEKISDLIIVGATRSVWPTCTSFALTYPWDLDGAGVPVRFRPDLTEFQKRRFLSILRKAGKLRNPGIFGN